MAGKPNLLKVVIVAVSGRPYQLRFHCPVEKRKVRRSTGSTELKEAERQRDLLAAELLTNTYRRSAPSISWDQFRDKYDQLELKANHRDGGRRQCNTILNLYTKIVNPQTLEQATTSTALIKFRNGMASGLYSRFGTRSPHTVVSAMANILAAFRWAEVMRLCGPVPKIPRYRAPEKKDDAKGRPLTDEEVQQLFAAVPVVTGAESAPSWLRLIGGMLESGLRLDEAMRLSWDDPAMIRPQWGDGLPTLVIPADQQKNNKFDTIALLPGFETMLLETPVDKRTGWVFNPKGIPPQPGQGGRPARAERPSADWAGKVITRIGEAAGIIVEPAKGTPPVQVPRMSKAGKRKQRILTPRKPTRTEDYTPPKYASAHDLRRTLADRLEAAGVDPMIIARIMRHKSYQTTKKFYAKGNIQRDAARLRELMPTGNNGKSAKVKGSDSTGKES